MRRTHRRPEYCLNRREQFPRGNPVICAIVLVLATSTGAVPDEAAHGLDDAHASRIRMLCQELGSTATLNAEDASRFHAILKRDFGGTGPRAALQELLLAGKTTALLVGLEEGLRSDDDALRFGGVQALREFGSYLGTGPEREMGGLLALRCLRSENDAMLGAAISSAMSIAPFTLPAIREEIVEELVRIMDSNANRRTSAAQALMWLGYSDRVPEDLRNQFGHGK